MSLRQSDSPVVRPPRDDFPRLFSEWVKAGRPPFTIPHVCRTFRPGCVRCESEARR